ncbi:hypothetical protein Q1695_011938 [Nippostrongylus brasiliensis]|nr:hypothetical protein Q1695_011938 [Nippostrongylus brasiliensis]
MWLRTILTLALLGQVISSPAVRFYEKAYTACPNGWMRFRDSCYYYEPTKMRFDKAEVECLNKGGTLFVPDSTEEWDMVIKRSPLNTFSWIGLEQEEDERTPRWKEVGGISFSKLNWLSSPPTPENNGFNSAAKCVAHYNSETTRYTYFHYCGNDFHPICEKNSTYLSQIWDPNATHF